MLGAYLSDAPVRSVWVSANVCGSVYSAVPILVVLSHHLNERYRLWVRLRCLVKKNKEGIPVYMPAYPRVN